MSIESTAPSGNGGTGAGANVTAQYANTGEFFFNKDYFAINNTSDTPPGFDYLSGNQLSDVYEISTLVEFPSTMPVYYRTDAGGWNDSSDYNRTNIGEIYVKCQYTELKNNATQCWAKINPQAIKNAYQAQGITHTNAEYASFIFNVKPQTANFPIRAQRRYRFVAYQYYKPENVDADKNYWNPVVKPQYLGSGTLPAAASQGPYLTARVESEQGVSSNVDGALNTPYWGFSSSAGSDVLDTLALISPNGNVNYGGDFYQQYLPYTASDNAQFPGGLEPTDTSIPAYNIPWTVEVGDQIKFQNTELQVYNILEITPPENTADNRLVLKLDREVPASIQKDFFILRRFRYSPNTVILNSLFPYGGLKVDQVEKDETTTDAITQFYDQNGSPVAADGAYYTSSMSSTSSVNPTFEYVERPLSKKDNTPSGILFPEFPTALIELEPDKVITDLRDKKLIT